MFQNGSGRGVTDPDGAEPGSDSRDPLVQARYDPEGALQRPAGGSPAPTHAVRLIDLPQYDTDRAPIEKRLTAFLTGLRKQRLLLAYFRDLREREQVLAPRRRLCLRTWADLRKLRCRAGLLAFRASRGRFRYGPALRIKRRADALVSAPAQGQRSGASEGQGGEGAPAPSPGRCAGGDGLLGAPGRRDRGVIA